MKVEVILSKSNDKVIKVDDILLCSKYNPKKEAEVFIDSYKHLLEEEIIHVVGLGAGYHLQELVSRINDSQMIKVYEENKEIIKIFKCEVNYKGLGDKIKIYSRKDIAEYVKTFSNSSDIILHKPSIKIMKDKEVLNIINKFIISRDSISKFSGIMMENEKVNSSYKYDDISKFLIRSSSKTKVVVSAGPSLDNVVKKLKKYRNKYEIYSVGAALRTLMENDIEPDLIVITDCQEVVKKQLMGYENSNIPLAFLSTASRWAVESYNGPKFIFYNKDRGSNLIVETGKTVAVAAIDLAIKSNPEKIILVGQDLAYLNNKTHSDSYKRIYGKEDTVRINGNGECVEGVTGENLPTTRVYLIFRDNIESLIKKHNNIIFINSSLGAKINGTKFIRFSEAI